MMHDDPTVITVNVQLTPDVIEEIKKIVSTEIEKFINKLKEEKNESI